MKTVLQVLFLLEAAGTWAQDEVNLDALVSDHPAPAPRQVGLPLNLYTDFDLDWTLPTDGSQPLSLVYAQNHREILIEAGPGSPLVLEGDLLAPGNFFDVGVPLALPFPGLGAGSVLGSSVLRTGILLLPFGEFNYHHLYGGREDNGGRFLDRVWSDLGVQWTLTPWDGARVDVYSTNGIRTAGSGPDWGPQQAGADNNSSKSLGLRFRQDFAPGWFVGVSGYRDPYGPDSAPGQVAQMAGLDAAAKWAALSVRFGGAYGLVQGFGADYFRYAWYGEGRWDFNQAWALRVRGGTMDTDSRSSTPYGDRADVNASVLWRTGPVEWDGDVFYDGPLAGPQPLFGTASTWEFLVKVLYTL